MTGSCQLDADEGCSSKNLRWPAACSSISSAHSPIVAALLQHSQIPCGLCCCCAAGGVHSTFWRQGQQVRLLLGQQSLDIALTKHSIRVPLRQIEAVFGSQARNWTAGAMHPRMAPEAALEELPSPSPVQAVPLQLPGHCWNVWGAAAQARSSPAHICTPAELPLLWLRSVLKAKSSRTRQTANASCLVKGQVSSLACLQVCTQG